MKILIQKILKILAKAILRKYKPKIVAVTGSVGKSSTKDAIYTVLKSQFNVRRSLKNYNNEIGVPLTVIGAASPGKYFAGWAKVFWKGLGLVLFPDHNFPEILVMEMAADHPGDIAYLVSIARPDISVVTSVAPVHLEFFKNLANIAREKAGLVRALPSGSWAVLNYDDEQLRQMGENLRAKVLFFGVSEGARLRGEDIFIDQELDAESRVKVKGLGFKINYAGSIMPAILPGVLARYYIYTALAAAAVGVTLGMNLLDISEALGDYQSPAGRMRLIQGVKHTSIIDDSYNSSPEAAKKAIETLEEIEILVRDNISSRRWAVLGDMMELGRFTEQGHLEVGRKVVEMGIDFLVTVGQRARIIARGAREQGMDGEKIFSFDNTEEAGKFLQERIEKGDLILVKGSQVMRMERIVKEIMAQPLKAKRLLVRHDDLWK